MGNLDSSLCRDLQIYNARKSKYDKFWEIAAAKIEEMTAVDDRRHAAASIEAGDVVVNMALAISALDLHKKCCQEAEKAGLRAGETPSHSWFNLQFWSKEATTHSAQNCKGRFSVKYMIQQRMARKAHDDVHYAGAVYKYAREYAVSIGDLVSFICTKNKHKILVGEPGFSVAALPCGHWVLVGKNEVFQVADHDFLNLSLIPTVILISHISESVEDSWYRGEPNVLLKITAISPSSALRNAQEVADVLIAKYGSIEQIPPALIMYTDTTFLSVKIAIIALQKFLNLDHILVARTAPGHSYCNPAEKINCILNLGLHGIGVMRKPSIDLEFELKLNLNSSWYTRVQKRI